MESLDSGQVRKALSPQRKRICDNLTRDTKILSIKHHQGSLWARHRLESVGR